MLARVPAPTSPTRGSNPNPPPIPPAVVTGSAQAFPPAVSQRDLWDGYFGPRFGGDRWAERVFMHAGVVRRHCAVDPRTEDVSGLSTAARMRRYADEGAALAKAAVAGALDDAGVDADRVGLLVVASCTGYAAPGIDVGVAGDLGFGPGTQRLLVGHMGCHAAIPALGVVADHARARGSVAVLLCLELTSLHLQPDLGRPARGGARPGTVDLDQLVSHALFGDAAAAVVVEPGAVATSGPGGLKLVDVAARSEAATSGLMTWEVTDTGFRMNLSRQVPDVLARHVSALVDELCRRNGADLGEIVGWAVHPGGPRVLDVVADRLGLGAEAMADSRGVLAEHGNCSSATILVVLDRLVRDRGLRAGQKVVALAFGPGLTLYAALLEATG